jgi:glycosyltransferase involved in cell wall biosynthesis
MSEPNLPGLAIIEPVGGHGGMNFYDFALAEALSGLGVETVVYTCDETQVPASTGFETELPFRRIFGDSPKLSARRRRLRIAHFHLFHSGVMEWLSVMAARLTGLRVVITAHDVTSFAGSGSHATGRRIYGLADGIIAHNRASAEELVSALGLTHNDIDVISSGNYMAVCDGAPDRQTAREGLGIPQDKTLVLFFGQIKEVKGLDLLIEAFAGVCDTRPALQLMIAGKVWKDDFSRYQTMIDERGIADRVRLDIRFIPDDEVADYYAAADILVLPYRRIYQSAVLLMALSHGRAVLVSDLPGMTDIVTHDETGLVFACGDTDQLRDRLERLVDELALRERLERAALALMRDEYAWERVAAETLDVYLSAVSR